MCHNPDIRETWHSNVAEDLVLFDPEMILFCCHFDFKKSCGDIKRATIQISERNVGAVGP